MKQLENIENCLININDTNKYIYKKLQDIYDLLAQQERHKEIIDTCKECGCTEFLCGHNKRG